jgi:hypothetical protein
MSFYQRYVYIEVLLMYMLLVEVVDVTYDAR